MLRVIQILWTTVWWLWTDAVTNCTITKLCNPSASVYTPPSPFTLCKISGNISVCNSCRDKYPKKSNLPDNLCIKYQEWREYIPHLVHEFLRADMQMHTTISIPTVFGFIVDGLLEPHHKQKLHSLFHIDLFWCLHLAALCWFAPTFNCQDIPSTLVLCTRSLSQVQLQLLFFSALSYIVLNFNIVASLLLLIYILHHFLSILAWRCRLTLNQGFLFQIFVSETDTLGSRQRFTFTFNIFSQDYWLQFLSILWFTEKCALAYTMSELSIEHCAEDLGAMLNNHVFLVWHCWISVYPCSFPTRESLLKSSWVQSSSLVQSSSPVHQIVTALMNIGTALMNIDWTSVMMHHQEVILAKQQADLSWHKAGFVMHK